jgi:hypothetical protein
MKISGADLEIAAVGAVYDKVRRVADCDDRPRQSCAGRMPDLSSKKLRLIVGRHRAHLFLVFAATAG